MPYSIKYFSDQVRWRREQVGITQQQLADRARCCLTTVKMLEYGRGVNITLDLATRLANALYTSMDSLLAPCPPHPRRKRGRPIPRKQSGVDTQGLTPEPENGNVQVQVVAALDAVDQPLAHPRLLGQPVDAQCPTYPESVQVQADGGEHITADLA